MGMFSNPNNQIFALRRFMQYWLCGNLIGAIAYGVAITLSANCFLLLARSNATSTRTRRVMMALVGCMCIISTVSFISTGGGVLVWSAINPSVDNYFQGADAWDSFFGLPFSPGELILIVLATWVSDGFMIWRCVVLYDGVSPMLRVCVMVLVGLLVSASLASGLCSIITPLVGKIWTQWSILSLLELLSLIVNGSISTLIILRILYHQRFLRRTFGPEYGSAYTKVMTMLIKSAALTFLLSFLHIVILASKGKPTVLEAPVNMILIKLIPQINIISPLLIIFRVAQGRTWQTDPTKTMEGERNGHEMGTLHRIEFAANVSIGTTADSMFSLHETSARDEETGDSDFCETSTKSSL